MLSYLNVFERTDMVHAEKGGIREKCLNYRDCRERQWETLASSSIWLVSIDRGIFSHLWFCMQQVLDNV